MEKSKYFEREINLIQSEDYRMFIKYYLDNYVPKYFWEIGASSSGKYHPQFSQGEGGLVRHTKAVVMFAEELLRMSSYMYLSEEHKDYVIMACIVHDTCKYGGEEFDKELYKDHAVKASVMVDNAWFDYFGVNASEFFLSAIKCHMGQWSERENRPFTNIDRCVHMADYMASRNFIDIPQVSEEWAEVHSALNDEERGEADFTIEFSKQVWLGNAYPDGLHQSNYIVKWEQVYAKSRKEAFDMALKIQKEKYPDYNIGSICRKEDF